MYSVAKHTLGTREQEATMSKVGLMWQLLVTNSDILLKICQLDSIHLFWSKNWVATADKNYSKLMSWNWNWTLILFDWGKIVAWRKKYPIRSLPAKVPKTRNIWTMEGSFFNCYKVIIWFNWLNDFLQKPFHITANSILKLNKNARIAGQTICLSTKKHQTDRQWCFTEIQSKNCVENIDFNLLKVSIE